MSSKRGVFTISAVVFLVYVKMMWSQFNGEQSRISHSANLDSVPVWNSLTGFHLQQLHKMAEAKVNRTFEEVRLLNITDLMSILGQINS